MSLVVLQIFQNVFLLSQFGIEEVGVRFELSRELFVLRREELGLVSDTLEEGIVDFCLDVVLMVSGFLGLVVTEHGVNFLLKLVFLLVQVHYYIIVLLLFFIIFFLDRLEILSLHSEFLDLWSKLSLFSLDLGFNLLHKLSNFLKGAILLAIKLFFLF